MTDEELRRAFVRIASHAPAEPRPAHARQLGAAMKTGARRPWSTTRGRRRFFAIAGVLAALAVATPFAVAVRHNNNSSRLDIVNDPSVNPSTTLPAKPDPTPLVVMPTSTAAPTTVPTPTTTVPNPTEVVSPDGPWRDGQEVTVEVHDSGPREYGAIILCLDLERGQAAVDANPTDGDGLGAGCMVLDELDPMPLGASRPPVEQQRIIVPRTIVDILDARYDCAEVRGCRLIVYWGTGGEVLYKSERAVRITS